MRNFILFSILLNIALAVAAGYRVSRNPAVFTSGPGNGTLVTNEESVVQFLKRKKVQQTLVVTNEAAPFTWANVESPEYKTYITNLRRIGCPEETIRDIIIADVEKHYRGKLAPLRKPPEEIKFWKRENYWGQSQSPEFNKAVRDGAKEKKALLKELLGDNYFDEVKKQWDAEDEKDPFASVSEVKQDQMEEINGRFSELQQEIYRRAKGELLEEDNKALEKLRKQHHDELAKVLTPDELFELEVRTSDLAQNMKWNDLQAFDATEDEFRAIFKAKQAQQYAASDDLVDEKAKREQERLAEKQTDEQLKQALGADRFKEYHLAQDYEYRQVVEATDRLDLSRDVAKQVYGMKDDVEKAMKQVKNDKTLTAEQRKAQLQEIKTATEQELIQTLGEKGYQSLKRNSWWIQNMVPAKPKS